MAVPFEQQLIEKLNARAEELCQYLLPNGQRTGDEWKVGSVEGEAGKSLSICLAGEKAGVWKDFAEDGVGGPNFLTLWMQVQKISEARAFIQAKTWLAQNSPAPIEPPFDWEECVAAADGDRLYDFAKWRGYSLEFVLWLKKQKLIGFIRDEVGIPLHEGLQVVGAHFFNPETCNWRMVGSATRPLIIGNRSSADAVHIFESQWDAFALIDKLKIYEKKSAALIVTRGAANGRMVEGLITKGATAYAWPQNDEPKNGKRAGDEWTAQVCRSAGVKVRAVSIPNDFKDLNDWTKARATAADLRKAISTASVREDAKPAQVETRFQKQNGSRARLIEFFTPSQLKNYQPAPGTILVGDYHIMRGARFVIGGPPGVGKSRSAIYLAICGATQQSWFGLKVHCKFRTMIIQNENGKARWNKDFSEVDTNVLDEYVRICAPPPFGIQFDDPEFVADLQQQIEEFQPAVVIIDPWNSVTHDDKAKDYLLTFEKIRRIFPADDSASALGIIAHTRKPKSQERRTSGRALQNLLSGSYVLTSYPRSVFVMESATDDPEEDHVVWTCCKNADGKLGKRSAWHRESATFVPEIDFDWDAFDSGGASHRALITEADIKSIFQIEPRLKRADAARRLAEQTGAKRAACYSALKSDGRFRHLLREDGDFLTLAVHTSDAADQTV